MNQVQRDLTYRQDAVQQVCDQYGQESEICQQSIQIYESQHVGNVFNDQMFSYIKLTGGILAFFILGTLLFTWFFKLLTLKINKQDQ